MLLQHIKAFDDYSEKHMNMIETENPTKSVTDKHNETFAGWLKDDCSIPSYDEKDDPNGDKQLVYNFS